MCDNTDKFFGELEMIRIEISKLTFILSERGRKRKKMKEELELVQLHSQ